MERERNNFHYASLLKTTTTDSEHKFSRLKEKVFREKLQRFHRCLERKLALI
jgi:hypothetical protein